MRQRIRIPKDKTLNRPGYVNQPDISEFVEKISEIPEVQQVSIYNESGYPDIYVVFNSKDKVIRLKIYALARDILLKDPDNPVDFHTINLGDFDESGWRSIIPRDATVIYTK